MRKTRFNLGAGAWYSQAAFLVSVDYKFEEYEQLNAEFHSKKVTWGMLDDRQKGLSLALRHEQDHHRLLNSTPFGVFLWLLNQVIIRDICYLDLRNSQVCDAPEFVFDIVRFPRKTREVSLRLQPALRGIYMQTGENLRNLLEVQDILVGERSYRRFDALTCEAMAEKLNAAFVYMAIRLGLPKPDHITSESPQALVFGHDEQFNGRDVIECHAMNTEVVVAQSENDLATLAAVKSRAEGGLYAPLWQRLRAAYPYENLSGQATSAVGDTCFFSLASAWAPYNEAQLVDFGDFKPQGYTLEKMLPWKRASKLMKQSDGQSGVVFSSKLAGELLHGIISRHVAPLFTDKARWAAVTIPDEGEILSEEQEDQLAQAVALNFATYLIHSGVKSSLDLLGSYSRVLSGDLNNEELKHIQAERDLKRRSDYLLFEFSDQYWINDTEILDAVHVGHLLEEAKWMEEKYFKDATLIAAQTLRSYLNEDHWYSRCFADWVPMDKGTHDTKIARMTE